LDVGLIPEIRLDPPPASWPDPADYEEDDEKSHE
jgi:hypothetical protein